MKRMSVLVSLLILSVSIFLTAETPACDDKKEAVAAAKKRIADARDAIEMAKASRNVNMIGTALHHIQNNNIKGELIASTRYEFNT